MEQLQPYRSSPIKTDDLTVLIVLKDDNIKSSFPYFSYAVGIYTTETDFHRLSTGFTMSS